MLRTEHAATGRVREILCTSSAKLACETRGELRSILSINKSCTRLPDASFCETKRSICSCVRVKLTR